MEFIDLKTQLQELRPEVDRAISKVLDHGQFILGPEVQELEKELADFANVPNCITCANGTDALVLALRALGIGRGDAVIVPTFTFAATAESVCNAGATPIFVDVQSDTYNIDPESIETAIETAIQNQLTPRAIISVDLFGLPADYARLSELAKAHNLKLIADAAQSFGAKAYEKPVGSLANVTTTSFFPAKPLGCYGDGGAVFTQDQEVANQIKSLRVHGKGADKYDNISIGYNSRLDTLQAAILLVKLSRLTSEIAKKDVVAKQYSQRLSEKLSEVLTTPNVINSSKSAWAQYTVQCDPKHRQAVTAFLKDKGIPTAIYYPTPLHKSTAYKHYPKAGATLPNADLLAQSVFSLPMHAYLSDENIDLVVSTLEAFDWK